MSYVAVGRWLDPKSYTSGRGGTVMDWREGAADTPEKRRARKKMAEMEARRYGRPDLFTGDSPEMAARRARAQAEKDAMDAAAGGGGGGGEVASGGGGMSTYLMLGGAALVLLFVLKKRKK